MTSLPSLYTTAGRRSRCVFEKNQYEYMSSKAFRNPHNLPVKTCVTCKRPFTWRKKWEKCWEEVSTCSKKCNRERRRAKRESAAAAATAQTSLEQCEDLPGSKAERRQRRKQLKAQRRARREGTEEDHDVEAKSKACALCGRKVRLLVRCRITANKHDWTMVCGRCWKKDSVSGGVPDGSMSANPHYTYGGLWKAR